MTDVFATLRPPCLCPSKGHKHHGVSIQSSVNLGGTLLRRTRQWKTAETRFLARLFIDRLRHLASELSGFTCTSSQTMNEKFQYRGIENFDNSRAMSVLTFLLFKLNTLQTKIVKLWVRRSHAVMTVVYWIYTTIMTSRRLFRHNPMPHGTINQSENRNSHSVWKLNNKKQSPIISQIPDLIYCMVTIRFW